MKRVILFYILCDLSLFGQNLQEIKITPTDIHSNDHFGTEIVLKDSLLFVTAIAADDPVLNGGSAYIFRRSENNWLQYQKIPGTQRSNSNFGISLAVSEDSIILVGAPDDTANGLLTGAAYLYGFDNGYWYENQKIYPEPDSGLINKNFGYSVGMTGNLIATGAPNDGSINSIPGSVYIFEKDSMGWVQSYKITISDKYNYAHFGNSVFINNNILVVGSPGTNDYGDNSGSVYIYKNVNGSWELKKKLLPDDLQTGNYFGGRVTVYDSTMAVSAYGDIFATNYRGAVYLFEKINDDWIMKQKISPGNDFIERLGSSVKLYRDTLLIGAVDSNSVGLVCLYVKEENEWVKKIELRASSEEKGDAYGANTDMGNGIFIISATSRNHPFGYENAGAVFIYQTEPVSVDDSNSETPSGYYLYQNYPNPFNPTTRITYSLIASANVRITVYDILGSQITELINKQQNAGNHELIFNNDNLSSGVYIYRLVVSNNGKILFADSKQMILLR